MTLEGADISHWQGDVNMSELRAEGESYVFAKASDGSGGVDPKYGQNRGNAHGAGLVFGSYHFAENGDPIGEANHFCDVMGAANPGELVALDWEVAGDAPAFSLPFLRTVRDRLGVVPGIYLNNFYLTHFDWSAVIAENFWLWYARYNGEQNDAPVWPTVAFKQYTSTGTLAGIFPIDRNVFYGDLSALAKYGKSAPTPPPARPHLIWPYPYSGNDRFGLISNPSVDVHGGINAAEQRYIIPIQQSLVWKGYVPGVSNWQSVGRGHWCDGVFGQDTVNAVVRFQHNEKGNSTTRWGEVWGDDYAVLNR